MILTYLSDKNGHSPLHIAAEKGNKSQVNAILDNPQISSLINEGDDNGNTPLHVLAISRKYIETFLKHPELDEKAVNYDHMLVFVSEKKRKKQRNKNHLHSLFHFIKYIAYIQK